MKNIIKTSIYMCIAFATYLFGYAQTLSPQVIASGGASFTNAAGTLQYTMGQAINTTLNNGTNILTQGFQQPEQNISINVQIKFFLEGAYSAGNMNTALRTANLLPLNQPYNVAPWYYNGTENVAAANNIPANAVDWILVELRSNNVGNTPLVSQAGFLLNNGTVVNTQGGIGLNFNVAAGNYYLVVRHRNHIAAMSNTNPSLPNATPYDFSTAMTQAFGTNQQANLGSSVFGLLAADVNADGVVTVADYNLYQTQIAAINVYANGDLNLDKHVTVTDFNLYQSRASHIGISQIRY